MKSPISGKELEEIKICKDHLVTKDDFSLYIEKETELLVTYPQPRPEEIGKYYESEEYNSHSDKAVTTFDKVYEFVKTINLNSKYSKIGRDFSGVGSILDIGCGAGDFLYLCKSKGWIVGGVEPTEKARNISENKLDIKIYSSIDLTIIPDNSYDVITMWHVLEHRYDIMETISNLKRIVKPGGLLIIAVPNYNSYDAEFYKEYWAAYDVPRHLFHFTRKTIEIIFDKNDLKLSRIYPMWFDSFYVSLISEKNMTGKMNVIRAIYIGIISNLKALFTKQTSSIIYTSKVG